MTELRGVIPISATPFDADGRVDEDSIVTLVEFEAPCGVHGLNVLGMTGVAVPDIYSCASAGGAPSPATACSAHCLVKTYDLVRGRQRVERR